MKFLKQLSNNRKRKEKSRLKTERKTCNFRENSTKLAKWRINIKMELSIISKQNKKPKCKILHVWNQKSKNLLKFWES